MRNTDHQSQEAKTTRGTPSRKCAINPFTNAPYEFCNRCQQPLYTHCYKIDGEKICQNCLDRDPPLLGHCDD